MDKWQKGVKGVYRKTSVSKLDVLLAEESRWSRKFTIAGNKLKDVRQDINRLAANMAQAVLQKELE